MNKTHETKDGLKVYYKYGLKLKIIDLHVNKIRTSRHRVKSRVQRTTKKLGRDILVLV